MSRSVSMSGTSRLPILLIILVSYLMIVLDISIVITGLPRIREDLGFTPTALSWVQNAYTLAFGGFLLLAARAGDLLGRRRVFMAGLALFTVASLLVGLAQTPAWLLAARAVQGIGAAVLGPSTLALLTSSFPEGPQRTSAVAYYGSIGGIGAAVGLVFGGVLADMLSWRMGFFINVPLGLALLWGAARFLPENRRTPGELDLPGAISSVLGMTALVYSFVRSADAGWRDLLSGLSLATGVILLTVFVLHERRARQPIMPLRLFASRERSAAIAARVLFLGGMSGFWFFTTQVLQGLLGYSPLLAGVAFLPVTLVNFAAALAVPRLTQRFGNERVLASGLLLGAAGLAWLSRVSADTTYLTGVALPMLLIGVGQGGVLAPLTTAGVAGVAPEDAGAASGLVSVAHQLGNSLGLSVLVTVFAAAASGPLGDQALLAHRLSAALTAAAALLTLALVLVLTLMVRPARTLHRRFP